MPISDSSVIPSVLKVVSTAKPSSVLDVGVGWGRYGALFRFALESGYPDISNKSKWAIKIDGVEVFDDYIGDIQKSVYNNIHIGAIEEVLDKIENYDVVFLGDVIEHLEKKLARAVLDRLLLASNKFVMVVTPNGSYEQHAVYGNEKEEHVSEWGVEDFYVYPNVKVFANKKIIIAIISKTEIRLPFKSYKLGSLKLFPFGSRVRAYIGEKFGVGKHG